MKKSEEMFLFENFCRVHDIKLDFSVNGVKYPIYRDWKTKEYFIVAKWYGEFKEDLKKEKKRNEQEKRINGII